MISHKYKLIFIHIPRTGGSSIEKAILNNNSSWWKIHAPSKHLTAYSAKKIYQPYWDDYLKFTFVRNPWDRMVSMLKYGNFYGVNLNKNKKIVAKDYIKYFKKIEYDRRFFNLKQFEDIKTINNSVYSNIIGDELNFIGKFENIEDDFNTLTTLIGLPQINLPKIETSQRKTDYRDYYDIESKLFIEKIYKLDIEKFNYNF